jgi:molybdate transport system substrate-binding protein
LKKNFEGLSGIELTAQIKEGTPYDVFVSADMKYPDDLYKSGVATESPKIN